MELLAALIEPLLLLIASAWELLLSIAKRVTEKLYDLIPERQEDGYKEGDVGKNPSTISKLIQPIFFLGIVAAGIYILRDLDTSFIERFLTLLPIIVISEIPILIAYLVYGAMNKWKFDSAFAASCKLCMLLILIIPVVFCIFSADSDIFMGLRSWAGVMVIIPYAGTLLGGSLVLSGIYFFRRLNREFVCGDDLNSGRSIISVLLLLFGSLLIFFQLHSINYYGLFSFMGLCSAVIVYLGYLMMRFGLRSIKDAKNA
jgi:hypothetical protein